ncbi:MAG: phosphate acyltransferase, partial [Phenylobacterium sp.]|nr:phosphate acyltransferase [Phenylobacterium sp.]
MTLPDSTDSAPGSQLERLLALADRPVPVRSVVVHPVDDLSISGAVEAAERKLIIPILVGPAARIRAAADAAGLDISRYELHDAPHSHAAAALACQLAGRGEAEAVMKGALHTDELLEAVVAKDCGLRTERRMSHVFILDVPTYPKPLLVTDAAINIAPDLATKRDIVQNAIDCARAMGVDRPK